MTQTVPASSETSSGPRSARPDDIALFEGLIVSDPPARTQGPWVPASVTGHVVIVASLILIPILWPSPNPDVARIINFPDRPPMVAPPLRRGTSLVDRKPQARPTTPDPNPHTPVLTLLVEQPKEQELLPEPAEPVSETAGSETGSDAGSDDGMEGGAPGGQAGGLPGGDPGGCVGCTGHDPVVVKDYDQGPQIIRQTKPPYPQEAFVKKVEGVVLVEFLIDAQGDVLYPRVISSIPMLDAAAIATVKQWRFRPAVKHGQPVASIARAPVTFRIF